MNPGVTSVSGEMARGPSLALGFIIYLAVFGAIWAVLTNADSSSWMFGVPFAALAALVASAMSPIRRLAIRPSGVARFVGYFLRNSVVGGVDVAIRALHPSMPLSPGIIVVSLRLPTPTTRALLADTVSLLPGTLSAGLVDEVVALHVLDTDQPVLAEVRRIEDLIAGSLGISLPECHPDSALGEASRGGITSA